MKKAANICTHAGRNTSAHGGLVNPAIERGSTYLYPNLAAMRHAYESPNTPEKVGYGRHGTHTTRALESLLAEMEGGYAARLTPSGLSAITTAILSCVQAGDHVLMVDSAYDPTRHFCDYTLKRFGIDTGYYAPLDVDGLRAQIKPNTKVIFLEAPGSLTFEVQDIPAIVALAQEKQITTIMDNTWATPVLFPAMKAGINISVHAATKYLNGHSDGMMGVIITDDAHWEPLLAGYTELGQSVGSEETALTLRGVRSLPTRLKQHGESGIKVAQWLNERDEVDWLLHPAFESCPGHTHWASNFSGASGLFAFSLPSCSEGQLSAFLDPLEYFGIGVSWGGYESLAIPVNPKRHRTAQPWTYEGQLIRLHIGLENPDDLIDDLAVGLERFAAAA